MLETGVTLNIHLALIRQHTRYNSHLGSWSAHTLTLTPISNYVVDLICNLNISSRMICIPSAIRCFGTLEMFSRNI